MPDLQKEQENVCRSHPLRLQLRKPQKPGQLCTGGANVLAFGAIDGIFVPQEAIGGVQGHCVCEKIERNQNSQIVLNKCSGS